MQQAAASGSAAFQRGAEANIAYFNGWLAARKGDYAAAGRAADRVAALVAQDRNPRKLEPVHELKGYIALYQSNFREAAAQFALGNLVDPYIKYQYAVALVGAGEKTKGNQLMRELATYNFNNVGYALIRKNTQQVVASYRTPPDRTPRPGLPGRGVAFWSHRLLPVSVLSRRPPARVPPARPPTLQSPGRRS